MPFKLIKRLHNDVLDIEALLFGQQGFFMQNSTDDYFLQLKNRYDKLRSDFSLVPNYTPLHYFRMRPNNFPTIRLAQLAQLLTKAEHFAEWLQFSVNEWAVALQCSAGDY